MTMTREKIEELKRTAQNAWPGPWAMNPEPFDNDGTPETVVSAMDGKAAICVTMDWGKNNPLMREANALHIAACDPKTILSLLALAERALEPQTPMDVTVYTLERLRGAMTRFGISCGEGGMEHFSVKFESHLLEFIRAATDSLDKLRQAYADLEASQSALEPQGQALPPEGQEISVDVSNGEHDALHRVFARLTGELGSDGKTWLAEMTEDNASQLALPAGPVPDSFGAILAQFMTPKRIKDLKRFDEFTQDGEGYDIDAEDMDSLADIGLIRRTSGRHFQFTDLGLIALSHYANPDRHSPAVAQPVAASLREKALEAADKIIADYKEHYDFPTGGESHMHDCITLYIEGE